MAARQRALDRGYRGSRPPQSRDQSLHSTNKRRYFQHAARSTQCAVRSKHKRRGHHVTPGGRRGFGNRNRATKRTRDPLTDPVKTSRALNITVPTVTVIAGQLKHIRTTYRSVAAWLTLVSILVVQAERLESLILTASPQATGYSNQSTLKQKGGFKNLPFILEH